MSIQFPNESKEYRQHRNELLEMEIRMRSELESLAAFRRELPMGGEVKEDYVFDEGSEDLNFDGVIKKIRFSDLFETGKTDLLVYNFMFNPEHETPCPACTCFMDSLNGLAPHLHSHLNLVIVAKAPIEKFRLWAKGRGWQNHRLLSSFNNSYNNDYGGEDDEGIQLPTLNVFKKKEESIFHFYNTELLYAETEPEQHPRHVDLLWPVWNFLDLTPEGRKDWFPKYEY